MQRQQADNRVWAMQADFERKLAEADWHWRAQVRCLEMSGKLPAHAHIDAHTDTHRRLQNCTRSWIMSGRRTRCCLRMAASESTVEAAETEREERDKMQTKQGVKVAEAAALRMKKNCIAPSRFASGVSRTAREVSFEGCPLPPEAPVLRGPSQRAPCISQRRVPYIQTHSGERHHRLVCETSLMPVYMSTDV